MNSAAQFDRYANSYDRALNSALSVTGETSEYYAEARISCLVRLLQRLAAPPVTTILDFGCGTGSAVPFFKSYFEKASIAGVDVSKESIAVAQSRFEHTGARFYVLGTSAANELQNVDLIFVNGVFHHILPAERNTWLMWLRERLAPNGILALFENNPWNPGTRFVMSKCEFDEDAICLSPLETARRMRSQGFRLIASRHLLFFPKFLRFLRPLEPFLGRIPLGGQYLCLGVPAGEQTPKVLSKM